MPPIGRWKSGVYSIRNKINSKQYIGSAARSIHGRLLDHKFRLKTNVHANQYLQNAWNKYGEEAFEFLPLFQCSPIRCLEFEQRYIDEYKTCDDRFGYNICPTAGSRLGTRLSPETCARYSAIAKVSMNQPHVRAKLSKATKEAMKNPELRKKLADAAKRRFTDPAARKKASEAAKKCQARPEVRAKHSAALKGKMSRISKEQWKKASRKEKAYRPNWDDPEYRKQQSEAMRKGWARRNAKRKETDNE